MSKFLMKPKIDFAFKEIMADEKARIGFLSAILKLNPKDSQSGYSQSAALLAHNLIAAIAAFQWELVLPLKQASPHPPLMPLRH